MQESKFEIKKVFSFTSRKIFVLGGILKLGFVDKGMIITNREKGVRQQISSIESMISGDHEPLIGLTFKYESLQDLEQLSTLSVGDIIIIASSKT